MDMYNTNSKRNKASFSIVIPYWNRFDLLSICIEHLRNQSRQDFEIILIDNGSERNPSTLLRSVNVATKYKRNLINRGFAIAANQGIEMASGEFILILNSDAFIESNYLDSAFNLFRLNPQTGMLAGRTLTYMDGRQLSKPYGGGHLLTKKFRKVSIKNLSKEQLVFSPEGGAQILRRSTLEDIRLYNGDLYDESYFSFGEDTDIFLRAHHRGWECLYSPTLSYWHAVSASLGGKADGFKKPLAFQYHTHKNRITTIIANLPTSVIIKIIVQLIVGEVGRFILYLSRRPTSLIPYIRAGIHTVVAFPQIIRKRRWILSRSKISPSNFTSLMK